MALNSGPQTEAGAVNELMACVLLRWPALAPTLEGSNLLDLGVWGLGGVWFLKG